MSLSRRQLFATSASGIALAGVGAATASPAAASVHSLDDPERGDERGPRPVGPLVDDPAGLLALPRGFSYRVVSQSGVTTMVGGAPSPDRPDGTGAFAVGSQVHLAQNHELGGGFPITNPVPAVEGTVFDAGLTRAGGVTTIELDRRGDRVREWVGLSGTIANCAGGVTPWGTWLSCEESDARAGTDFGTNGTAAQDHGWVFEVDPSDEHGQDPRPIRCFGRFPHEAVVIARDRRSVYLTEDAGKPNGLFYRWSAPRSVRLGKGVLPGLPATAGQLQAMAVRLPGGQLVDDLSRLTSADLGRRLQVSWVDVPDRLASETPTRSQRYAEPITRAKKLEGAWGDRHGVFFAASFSHGSDTPSGGVDHDGQIWYFDERSSTLVLKAYFPDVKALNQALTLEQVKALPTDLFDGPDNVHVTPYGGLVIAEDGEKVNGLVGWTEQTGVFRLARNDGDFGGDNSEMAGPTFSPDARTLFANQQEPGHTYAIRGPWSRHFA